MNVGFRKLSKRTKRFQAEKNRGKFLVFATDFGKVPQILSGRFGWKRVFWWKPPGCRRPMSRSSTEVDRWRENSPRFRKSVRSPCKEFQINVFALSAKNFKKIDQNQTECKPDWTWEKGSENWPISVLDHQKSRGAFTLLENKEVRKDKILQQPLQSFESPGTFCRDCARRNHDGKC